MVLGPYATHQEAIDNVERGTKMVYDRYNDAPWYSYGTAKMEGETLPKSVFGV